MKLSEIIQEPVVVNRFPMHFGRRSTQFEKTIWNPFIKELTAAMKQLKGKWNGSGFDFKDQTNADKAQVIMNDYKAKWEEIIKANPEGSAHIDSAVADEFFKKVKKSGNPNSF